MRLSRSFFYGPPWRVQTLAKRDKMEHMEKIELLESTPDIEKPFAPPTDDVASGPIMEVFVNSSWVETTEGVFKSWTGPRRINGEEHHGPIYAFGTETVYTGARVCSCRMCQSTVEPKLRPN